jgi:8-oxo-dGTP diphosphatase
MVELKTRRLVLRPPQLEDKQSLARRLDDWEVVKWLSNVPYPYTVSDAEAWIELIGTEQPNLNLSIFLQDELIGGVGLSQKEDGIYELGYWLAIEHWGKGIATEAANDLLAYGQRNLNCARIVASYLKGNTASAIVLRKLGFKEVGEGETYCISRKEQMPCVYLALS